MLRSRSPSSHGRSDSPFALMKQHGQGQYRPVAGQRDDAGLGFANPQMLPAAFPGPLYGAVQAAMLPQPPLLPVLMPVKAVAMQAPQFVFPPDLAKPYGLEVAESIHRPAASLMSPSFPPAVLDGSARGPAGPRGPAVASSGPSGERRKYTLIPITDPTTPTTPPPSSVHPPAADTDLAIPRSPDTQRSMSTKAFERDTKAPKGKAPAPSPGGGRRTSSPPKFLANSMAQLDWRLPGSPVPRPASFHSLAAPPRADRPIESSPSPSADGPSLGPKYVVEIPLPIPTPPHRVQKLTADTKVSVRRPVETTAPAVSPSRIVWTDAEVEEVEDPVQARLPPDVQNFMQEVEYQPYQVVCTPTTTDTVNYSAYAKDGFRREDVERWVQRVFDIVKTSYKNETLQRPAELLSFLFLGDVAHARSVPLLASMGITAVLNCAPGMTYTTRDNYPPHFLYHAVNAEDTVDYQLLGQHLDEAYQTIEQARLMGRKILVHCFAGINRSATLCIAYLMVHLRWPLLAAVRHVYQARPIILSNRGFMAELVLLAKTQGLLDDLQARPIPDLSWPFAGFVRA
eukprot:GGOE01062099.1.p1 GENE.GGOE01062099.1~~GGOE01062099.1.p1  ORF type:complete len:569 (-),score=118.23 GGOE01062099.1:242-1948(-)